MNVEKFFKEMYFNIWQSNDIGKLDEYYAKDFKEDIMMADDSKKPIEFNLGYDEIVAQARWQEENYKDTTIEYRKIVAGENNHISVSFYSTSVCVETNELHHRCVCGIWRLNQENKIDRVWAVVTPCYPPVVNRESQILETIEGYRQAYIQKDMPTLLSFFTKSNSLSIIGVRADAEFNDLAEWKKYLEQTWQQCKDIEINTTPLMVKVVESVGWVTLHYDAKIYTTDSAEIYVYMRASFVLAEENDGWKIHHLHFSSPQL